VALCQFTSLDADKHDVWINPLHVLSVERHNADPSSTMITMAAQRGDQVHIVAVRGSPVLVAGEVDAAINQLHGR
jgi:hypothetical protein